MRNSFIVALLVAIVVGGLSASAGFFSSPALNSRASGANLHVGEVVEPSAAGQRVRDPINFDESQMLVARKMLPPGTKSLLKVPDMMQHGDYRWNEEGVAAGKINIWVDLRRQMVSAFRNGHEIGTAVIVYGAEDKASPEGLFHVKEKKRHYHSRTYDAPMPASLFITDDGVALHGSPMSKRRASHGCIGLPVAFAHKLFDAANVGDPVVITSSDPRSSSSPQT